jgi:type I restriction enzyme, S subunit
MSELPEGWAETTVDVVCEKVRGVSYDKNEASREEKDGLVPILRANNIDSDHLTFIDLVFVPGARVSEKQKLQLNDVVIAMSSGSKSVVGKTAQVLEDWHGSFGAFCGVLRPAPQIDGRYFGYFFRTKDYRAKVSELSAGTNINNLKNEHFGQLEFPVPPLNEQRRIVTKLEKVLSRVDAAQTRLATIPRILKRFRQSILAAACSGRLTVDWRQEPNAGYQIGNTHWPEGWHVAPLNDLAKKIQDGNYGALYPKAHEWVSSGVAFITPAAIAPTGVIDREKIRFISSERNAELKKAQLAEGDVIFPNRGSRDAQRYGLEPFAISVPEDLLPANLNPQLTLVRPLQDVISSGYLRIALNAEFFLNQIRDATGGSALTFINLTETKLLQIPVPPRTEQQEIVRRVEALFKTVDALEARYRTAKAHVDKLTQSILAKAFRGELVPQNPHDEPASVLLERIKNVKPGKK